MEESIETFAVQHFLKYVKINSQSDPTTHVTPSTKCQFDMQYAIKADLEAMGLQTHFDEKLCILKTELPATNGSDKGLGFFVHVDTSFDAPGDNVKPLIHDLPSEITEDLVLPSGTVIDKQDFAQYAGKKLITSSGDTLLGADDKSGIAIVMGMLDRIIKENIPHPRLMVIFTPDEEIGESSNNIHVEELNLDYSYSIDGDEMGTYYDDGFNAFGAEVEIEGFEVHPGSAYGVMEDAGYILSRFNASLPQSYRPETTKDDEGYILCTSMSGCMAKASAKYILRSFYVEEMDFFKALMTRQIECLKKEYPRSKISITFKEQYQNPMRYLKDNTLSVKLVEAMDKVGIKAEKKYLRGGSDSSRLCQMGLPSIVMFAGGLNFHSRREFVPVCAINKGVDIVCELVQLF